MIFFYEMWNLKVYVLYNVTCPESTFVYDKPFINDRNSMSYIPYFLNCPERVHLTVLSNDPVLVHIEYTIWMLLFKLVTQNIFLVMNSNVLEWLNEWMSEWVSERMNKLLYFNTHKKILIFSFVNDKATWFIKRRTLMIYNHTRLIKF